MAQSVSNDALWLKLLEMDKKLDKVSAEQKTLVSTQKPAENKPDFREIKDEIITEINAEIIRLGRSSDAHFEANRKNIQLLNDNTIKVLNIVARIRKQQKEAIESQGKEKDACFNFWIFKVRKSSFVIAMLGLLVLILTLFCMKQQNDYSLLLDEYYRQGIIIKEIQSEADSLKNAKTVKYK